MINYLGDGLGHFSVVVGPRSGRCGGYAHQKGSVSVSPVGRVEFAVFALGALRAAARQSVAKWP